MADRANNVGTLVIERGNFSATLSFMQGARSSTLTARELRLAAEEMVKTADSLDAVVAIPGSDGPQGTLAPRVRRRTR